MIVRGATNCCSRSIITTATSHYSPDAADPAMTTRVLTIMRADEYSAGGTQYAKLSRQTRHLAA